MVEKGKHPKSNNEYGSVYYKYMLIIISNGMNYSRFFLPNCSTVSQIDFQSHFYICYLFSAIALAVVFARFHFQCEVDFNI